MPAAILAIVSAILPLAVKVIIFLIDKKYANDELKKQFLELLQQMDHDLPVTMRERHKQQIERIKEKLRGEK